MFTLFVLHFPALFIVTHGNGLCSKGDAPIIGITGSPQPNTLSVFTETNVWFPKIGDGDNQLPEVSSGATILDTFKGLIELPVFINVHLKGKEYYFFTKDNRIIIYNYETKSHRETTPDHEYGIRFDNRIVLLASTVINSNDAREPSNFKTLLMIANYTSPPRISHFTFNANNKRQVVKDYKEVHDWHVDGPPSKFTYFKSVGDEDVFKVAFGKSPLLVSEEKRSRNDPAPFLKTATEYQIIGSTLMGCPQDFRFDATPDGVTHGPTRRLVFRGHYVWQFPLKTDGSTPIPKPERISALTKLRENDLTYINAAFTLDLTSGQKEVYIFTPTTVGIQRPDLTWFTKPFDGMFPKYNGMRIEAAFAERISQTPPDTFHVHLFDEVSRYMTYKVVRESSGHITSVKITEKPKNLESMFPKVPPSFHDVDIIDGKFYFFYADHFLVVTRNQTHISFKRPIVTQENLFARGTDEYYKEVAKGLDNMDAGYAIFLANKELQLPPAAYTLISNTSYPNETTILRPKPGAESDPSDTDSDISSKPGEKDKKKNTSMIIGISVFAVVLILIAGIVLIVYCSCKKKKDRKAAPVDKPKEKTNVKSITSKAVGGKSVASQRFLSRSKATKIPNKK